VGGLDGTLPPGVSLRMRPDLEPWFWSEASAGLIGVATVPGTYSFTLRVTSGASHAERLCTVKVTLFRSNDDYQLPDAFVGRPYTYTLTAAGNAGAVTFASDNPSLPPWLTLDQSGMISGTPTQSGTTTSLLDGRWHGLRGPGYEPRSLRHRRHESGQLPNALQNAPYAAQVTAAGGTGPYTFTHSGGLSGGLTLDPATARSPAHPRVSANGTSA